MMYQQEEKEPVRQIALDTETTGKNDDGTPGDHRVIEIGCVEIINRKLTGNNLQIFLNPNREVDEEATKVHGMTWESLKGYKTFDQEVARFIEYIRGAELLIHNAKFDTTFLNNEFELVGVRDRMETLCTIVDTVSLARQLHPGHQVSLDNLCNIFGVNKDERTFHGALLDSVLLAQVYLAMTGGQKGFELTIDHNASDGPSWVRHSNKSIKRMKIDAQSHAVHIDTILSLSQTNKMEKVDDVQMAGSNWSSDFRMEMLSKGEEESKGDFKKRLKAQKQELLSKMLSEAELKLLNDYHEEEQRAYKIWEDAVLGRTS